VVAKAWRGPAIRVSFATLSAFKRKPSPRHTVGLDCGAAPIRPRHGAELLLHRGDAGWERRHHSDLPRFEHAFILQLPVGGCNRLAKGRAGEQNSGCSGAAVAAPYSAERQFGPTEVDPDRETTGAAS
jgi:hypothetical protein